MSVKDLPVKGYTFGYGAKKGELKKDYTLESLDELCNLGVNYICLAFAVFTDTVRSETIRYRYTLDVSDSELTFMIRRMHEKGVSVCLKPMVNSLDHEWRARIDFGPDEGAWAKWFYEYEAYILHYAELAEEAGCEMLCVGCELCGTERRSAQWRHLVAGVRKVYSGLVTYNTNHGHELDADWYDVLDYLGTSGYFPVESEPGSSLEIMKRGWEKAAVQLEKACRKWNKPMLFMEAGCRSALGAAAMPWDYMHMELPRSEDEQARFFRSAVEVLSEKDWFLGFFWWSWELRLPDASKAERDKGFSICGKKAQQVLGALYRGEDLEG